MISTDTGILLRPAFKPSDEIRGNFSRSRSHLRTTETPRRMRLTVKSLRASLLLVVVCGADIVASRNSSSLAFVSWSSVASPARSAHCWNSLTQAR